MSRHLLLSVLAINVLVLLTLATVSGRWTKDRELADTWHETGIWSQCTCQDSISQGCARSDKYLRVVQGFSVIAALCEWIAVMVLAKEYLVHRGENKLFTIALVLYAIATVSNLITWATFGAYYRKNDLCTSGQKSFHFFDVKLNWAYGVRLCEFGLLVVLVALTALTRGKGADRTAVHYAIYLIAAFVLMLTVLTTSGRGWMHKSDTGVFEQTQEYGLWDNCLCQQQYNNNCIDARRRITVVEVFSVVSIIFTFVLIALLIKGAVCQATQAFQRVFALLGLIASIIVVVVFTQYTKDSYAGCGAALFDTQNLHWAYGAACAGLILQALVFFGSLLSNNGEKSTEPSH